MGALRAVRAAAAAAAAAAGEAEARCSASDVRSLRLAMGALPLMDLAADMLQEDAEMKVRWVRTQWMSHRRQSPMMSLRACRTPLREALIPLGVSPHASEMQVRCALDLSLTSDQQRVSSYALMWSLRPFVDEEVLRQLHKLDEMVL